MKRIALLTIMTAFTWACGTDDPSGTPDGGDRVDSGPLPDAPPQTDAGAECNALDTDYMPRENGSAGDMWAACISDDNQYHAFDINISSIARVAGFESIAQTLFTGGDPSPQDFIDARLVYLAENGLDSRVSRREDEHYPPAPMRCRDLTPQEQQNYPDRCVGPVQIQPLLNNAFADGASGIEPRLNAARIEAGLLWFLYVSSHKEATTCTTTVNDCDSSYAYYTGGEDRDNGLGLSRYVRTRSTFTHDRVWDGILAVRCWRDLDNPGGEAMDLAMRDRAISQLDRALLYGVAQIVRERMGQLEAAQGADKDAPWAFLQILGPVLDREAGERDPTGAEALRTELAKVDPTTVDATGFIETLDEIFDCP